MAENLTPEQIQAAQMLATGWSTSDIISKLKISERTLYRWKALKAFKELVHEIIAAELAETKFRMAHIVDASVKALWDLVASSRKDNTRLQAALHVLRLAGIVHIPSPNVTQTVEWVLKPEPPDIANSIEAQGTEGHTE